MTVLSRALIRRMIIQEMRKPPLSSGLTFDDDALDYIVEKALEFKLGARGLRSICESILIDDMFNLPGSKTKILHVDKSYIKKKLDGINFSGLKEAS